MDAAKADLMRALGRLARGLSTLFWCLPLTLVAQVETARTDWVDFLGGFAFLPALVLSALLWHGLRQMRDFQRQERIWQQALHRAEISGHCQRRHWRRFCFGGTGFRWCRCMWCAWIFWRLRGCFF